MFSQDDPHSAIFKQSLSTSPFIYFPSIPLDGRQYIIRIDSDLSTSFYKYSPVIYTFTANQSYAHFQFEFQITPKLRHSSDSSEHDVASSPLYSIPLFILGILFYYNKQALDFLKNFNQYRDQLLIWLGKRNLPTNGADSALKKKTVEQ